MSRWFRHYAGMMRDDKLVSAAVKSKQTVERVLWVWGALLESAAEVNDAGRFDFDAGEAAYFLRCDEGDISDILTALCAVGRVLDGALVKWSDRQFDSDQSKDRQKRYRERQQAARRRDSDVTQTSRDGGVTLQETDTDTDTDISSEAKASSHSPEPEKSAPVASSPTVFELPCVSGENFPVTEADVAEWRQSFPAVDIPQQLAAARSWLVANPTRRKTKRGMRKFVVSWMDRRQNSARPVDQPSARGSPPALTGMTVAESARLEIERMQEDENVTILPVRRNYPSHEIAGFAGTDIARRVAAATDGQRGH